MGDLVGVGMILLVMVIFRDGGLFLLVGVVLISFWVDLMYFFLSVVGDCLMDYILFFGFYYKLLFVWFLLDEDELNEFKKVVM